MATSTKTTDLIEYEEQFVDRVWNERDYSFIEETMSEDYRGNWFAQGGGTVDRDGLEEFVRAVHEGFSDFRMDIEFVFADDEKDMAVVGFTSNGTHDGEFMGIPPTGESGSIPGIMVHTFGEDGTVLEGWATWDALGLLQQVGVIPEKFTLASFLETGANLAKRDVLKMAKRD